MIITPKNWHEFQHYSKRRPPWIKVYRTLLDDAEYQMLPDASKALATMLWLLASESETAEINAASDVLAFRLRTTPKKIEDALKPLIKSGFFIVASGALAPRYQDAIPETETETETDKERETENTTRAERVKIPEGVDEQTWKDFTAQRKTMKAPVTDTAIRGIEREARTAGISLEQALQICCERGWRGFKAEWMHSQQVGTVQKHRPMSETARAIALLESMKSGN